jgi:hypothetical protein
MSAQYRTECAKLIAKYCRVFGVHESIVVCRNARGEDEIHCPSRPDLPSWGMGSNSEEWQDGPKRPGSMLTRPQ